MGFRSWPYSHPDHLLSSPSVYYATLLNSRKWLCAVQQRRAKRSGYRGDGGLWWRRVSGGTLMSEWWYGSGGAMGGEGGPLWCLSDGIVPGLHGVGEVVVGFLFFAFLFFLLHMYNYNWQGELDALETHLTASKETGFPGSLFICTTRVLISMRDQLNVSIQSEALDEWHSMIHSTRQIPSPEWAVTISTGWPIPTQILYHFLEVARIVPENN